MRLKLDLPRTTKVGPANWTLKWGPGHETKVGPTLLDLSGIDTWDFKVESAHGTKVGPGHGTNMGRLTKVGPGHGIKVELEHRAKVGPRQRGKNGTRTSNECWTWTWD
jgi:hypothetical protein